MESAAHANLVLKLARMVGERHAASSLVMLVDHVSYGANRPWSVDGFVPDLLATDFATDLEVLGEAKTPGDLETPRSIRQIGAFVQHVSLRPGGRFYLGVRWGHEPRAKLVLDAILREAGSSASGEVVGLA